MASDLLIRAVASNKVWNQNLFNPCYTSMETDIKGHHKHKVKYLVSRVQSIFVLSYTQEGKQYP